MELVSGALLPAVAVSARAAVPANLFGVMVNGPLESNELGDLRSTVAHVYH